MTHPEPREIRTRFAGVVGALTQLSFTVYRCLEEIAAGHGLSLVQGRLLVGLLDRYPTMSEVARMLYLERSSTTGLVMRAEAHGLVLREREGGQTRVALTPAGRVIAEDLAREVLYRMELRCRGLGFEERQLLDGLISRLIERTWRDDPEVEARAAALATESADQCMLGYETARAAESARSSSARWASSKG